MKSLFVGFVLVCSVSAFSSVNESINHVKSRIPELGSVQYNKIRVLNFGEQAVTNINFRVPTPSYVIVKKTVLCADSFYPGDIQQGQSMGRVFLIKNSVIALDDVLYICH